MRSGKSWHSFLRYGFSFQKSTVIKIGRKSTENRIQQLKADENTLETWALIRALTSKTTIMKGLLPPIINSLPLISLMQDPDKTQGIWKEKPKYRNVDIYKALGVKAPEGSETTASMVSMRTAKSGAKIKYLETVHCIWPRVDAQQTCTMWIV